VSLTEGREHFSQPVHQEPCDSKVHHLLFTRPAAHAESTARINEAVDMVHASKRSVKPKPALKGVVSNAPMKSLPQQEAEAHSRHKRENNKTYLKDVKADDLV